MTFRLILAAIAAASFANLAAARSIDLSGQTLLKSPPSDTVLAAYLDKAEKDGVRAAWLQAHREFGGTLKLRTWRLDGASFIDATLINPDFVGAELNGARFDAATLVNPRFGEARLRGASFTGAEFKAAENFFQTDPSSKTFLNTDLTGAIFSKRI